MGRKKGKNDNDYSRLLVIGCLLPGPVHDLPAVSHETRDRHPGVLVDGVHPPSRRPRDEHPILQWLLDAQHHAVGASQSQGRPGILDGLGGVLDLEDATVGGESRRGEIVSGSGGCHRCFAWLMLYWLLLLLLFIFCREEWNCRPANV